MKVLLIEDEKQLRTLEIRMLNNLGHEAIPCESAEKGFTMLENNPDIPFILLDMVLPGMSGLEFAQKVRALPNGDRPYILAITSWSEEQLKEILAAGANDYIQKPIDITRFNIRIRIAEQFIHNIQERVKMQQQMCAMVTTDVLQGTLNGFIRVVTNVLSLVAPTVFGRSTRVARIVRELSPMVNLEDNWELTAAAMLSQIGCVTIPHDIMQRALDHSSLSPEEQTMFLSHADNGAELIENVPRMQHIARTIRYQEKHFDGSGSPVDNVKEDDIPAESRILKIALDLDTLLESNVSRKEAFDIMKGRSGWYDPKLLQIFSENAPPQAGEPRRVWINQLKEGMIFAEDVRSKTGALLVMKGHEVTPTVQTQLVNFSKNFHIQQPIEVSVPPSLT